MAFTTPGPGKADYGLVRQSVWYRFTITNPTTVRLDNIRYGYPNLFIYGKRTDGTYYLYGSSMNSSTTAESVAVGAPGTYWARVIIEGLYGIPTWTISW